jgi:solute carrier family 25 (adenine nucleotide translocator) protein 4/5/6/31
VLLKVKIKSKFSVLTDSSTWLEIFLLGWAVTIISGISAYPLDTGKRRMMMTAGQEVKYTSAMACLKEVMSKEGSRALFRGAGVNIVRGAAGAGVLTGFVRMKKVYISKREIK